MSIVACKWPREAPILAGIVEASYNIEINKVSQTQDRHIQSITDISDPSSLHTAHTACSVARGTVAYSIVAYQADASRRALGWGHDGGDGHITAKAPV